MSTPSDLGEISAGEMSLGICKQENMSTPHHDIERLVNSYRKGVKVALQGILVYALSATAVVAARKGFVG